MVSLNGTKKDKFEEVNFMKDHFDEGIIDVHAHFLMPDYINLLKKHDAIMEDGFPLPDWKIEKHLELMEKCHISWSLLSLSSPHPYFKGYDKEALSICRKLNEACQDIKRNYPNQFGFSACLPLPNVEAAIEEAIYALDVLHADGIKLASNSRGQYLGCKELEPLMEELNKRSAVCNIHPHRPEPIKEGLFSSGPVPLFEFLADTTRSVLNLVSNGVILRYPNIKWIIPHCGSFLPNIYDRYLGMSKVLIPQGMMEDIDVKKSFEKLYYDLSGNPAPNLLRWLLTITSEDHILYGSDYPFTAANQIETNLDKLEKMLNEEDLKSYKSKILRDNGKKLFMKD